MEPVEEEEKKIEAKKKSVSEKEERNKTAKETGAKKKPVSEEEMWHKADKKRRVWSMFSAEGSVAEKKKEKTMRKLKNNVPNSFISVQDLFNFY